MTILAARFYYRLKMNSPTVPFKAAVSRGIPGNIYDPAVNVVGRGW